MSKLIIILLGLAFAISYSGEQEEDLAEKIIAMERSALDRWGQGDPWAYIEIYAAEVTYFDIETERRLDGLEALRQLYAPIKGKVKIERYEMVNPKVQLHGDTAVLTFNLIDWTLTPDGTTKEVRWNSTEVYSKINGEWKIIHSHWSLTKPKLQE